MAGLIAMSAVLMVVGIEMFFATRGAGHMHGSEYDTLPNDNADIEPKHMANGNRPSKRQRRRSLRMQNTHGAGGQANGVALGALGGSSEQLVWGRAPTSPRDSSTAEDASKYHDADSRANDSDLDLDELDPTTEAVDLLANTPRPDSLPRQATSSSSSKPSLSDHQLQQKLLLQCLLLEAGILFHSIFIGMALSIATSTPFIVLLIAISFHQTFEGLALGSRIAAIPALSPTSPKPWLMALAYGLTTPCGQAIGLAVHGLYDPQSQTGLLMIGVTNAVSSGLLVFAGLVELLAEDFLSDGSYVTLRGRRRLEACGAVVGGAMLMAVVGAWA